MTDYLIRNNLRKKELVVIESKQKLQSFVLPHPHSIFLLLTLYFLRKVSMNYNITFQNVFVMPKIYVLGLCDHIQFKIVTIMHVCIVAQVLLISSIWHCLHFIFILSKFKTRIHSKSCTVRNALKKQIFRKYFISIHYYEAKHSFYNSGIIWDGFFNPTL